MSRIGIFSDLHLHNFKQFSKPVGKGLNSRAVETLKILDQVVGVAESLELEAVLFCGDMFESRGYISVALLKEAKDRIRSIARICPVIMIAGNHDQATKEEDTPNAVELFSDIEGVMILSNGDSTIIGGEEYEGWDLEIFGFEAGEKLTDLINPSRFSGDYNRILLLHETIKGTAINSTGYVADFGIPKNYLKKYLDRNEIDFCFIGDIHVRQKILDNCWYVGNTIQKEFGEDQDKGILILEDGEVYFLPLESPQFKSIDFSDLESEYNETDYFRVTVSSVEEYEQLNENWNYFNIKPIPDIETEKKERSEIGLDMDKDELLETYIDTFEFTPDERKKLLDKGKEIVYSL